MVAGTPEECGGIATVAALVTGGPSDLKDSYGGRSVDDSKRFVNDELIEDKVLNMKKATAHLNKASASKGELRLSRWKLRAVLRCKSGSC